MVPSKVLPQMRFRLEYAPVWLLANLMRLLPRPLVRAICISLALLIYVLHGRLGQVGMRNLDLAFPGRSVKQKKRILRGVFTSLGRQLAEFTLFPRYNRENVSRIVIYDGFQNFAAAQARGKGVLCLTAHLGGWEISSFAHSHYGHPHGHQHDAAARSVCGFLRCSGMHGHRYRPGGATYRCRSGSGVLRVG